MCSFLFRAAEKLLHGDAESFGQIQQSLETWGENLPLQTGNEGTGVFAFDANLVGKLGLGKFPPRRSQSERILFFGFLRHGCLNHG